MLGTRARQSAKPRPQLCFVNIPHTSAEYPTSSQVLIASTMVLARLARQAMQPATATDTGKLHALPCCLCCAGYGS